MKQLVQLIDVKSLVTLAMTGAMIALLFAPLLMWSKIEIST